jgi:hypothetical protein
VHVSRRYFGKRRSRVLGKVVSHELVARSHLPLIPDLFEVASNDVLVVSDIGAPSCPREAWVVIVALPVPPERLDSPGDDVRTCPCPARTQALRHSTVVLAAG